MFFFGQDKNNRGRLGFRFLFVRVFFSFLLFFRSRVFFTKKKKKNKLAKIVSFIRNSVCQSLLTKILYWKEIFTKNKFIFCVCFFFCVDMNS